MAVFSTEVDAVFLDDSDANAHRKIRIRCTVTLDGESVSVANLVATDETNPKAPVPASDWQGPRLSGAIEFARNVAAEVEANQLRATGATHRDACVRCRRWGKVPQPGGSV